MADWSVKGGNLSATAGSSDSIGFSGPGGGFSTPVIAGAAQGQEGTWIRSYPGGTNGGELPNCQYLTNSTVFVDGETKAVSAVAAYECTICLQLTGMCVGAVGTTNSYLDAYGTTTADSPADGDVRVFAFEVANTAWTELDYINSKRLSLANQTPALTHTWYLGLSVRAIATGAHSDINFRITTEYYS